MKKEKTILYGGISNTPEERAEILYNHPDNDRKEKIIERHIIEYIPVVESEPMPNMFKSNLGMISLEYTEAPQKTYSRDLKKERRDSVNDIRVNKRTNVPQIQKNPKERMDYINNSIKSSAAFPEMNNPVYSEISMKPAKKSTLNKDYQKIAEMFYPEMEEESQIKVKSKHKEPLYEVNEIIEDKPLTIADTSYILPIDKGIFTGGAANINNGYTYEELKNMAVSENDKKFFKCLDFFLSDNIEGGYNNRKTDKPTNLGVTQSIYDIYRKDNGLKKQNVKNITMDEAVRIYYKYFWLPSKASKLEFPLGLAYFDMYINSSPKDTKDVLNRSDNDVYKFIDNRKIFYDDVIKNKPWKEEYRKGWYNRLELLKKYIEENY